MSPVIHWYQSKGNNLHKRNHGGHCRTTFFFNKFIYLFIIYFWLHCVFVAACGLSLVVVSGGYSSLRCTGFSLRCLLLLRSVGSSLRWLLLLRSMGSRHASFSSCSTWAQQLWLVGSRAQAQQLWCTGLVAPWHVGSSWTRDQTRVPYTGRQILNHCASREVPQNSLELVSSEL